MSCYKKIRHWLRYGFRPRVDILDLGWQRWKVENDQLLPDDLWKSLRSNMRRMAVQACVTSLASAGYDTAEAFVSVLRAWKAHNPEAWQDNERITYVGMLAGCYNAFLPEDLQ